MFGEREERAVLVLAPLKLVLPRLESVVEVNTRVEVEVTGVEVL